MKAHTDPSTERRYGLIPLTFAATLALFCFAARADTDHSADAVKAAFLYRFAGYVEWPSSAPPTPGFTIAVLCGKGVADELDRLLAGHAIKGQPVQVRRVDNMWELGLEQIVYVGSGCYLNLRDRLEPLARRPMLVVTDEPGGLEDGSTINFVSIDHHVRFEISLQSAERSGLRISSELLSVAARVLGVQER